jgi:hypothetical protein
MPQGLTAPPTVAATPAFDDPVRNEVEAALSRKIPVVPLLIASPLPSPEQLPPSMQELRRWQAMEVTPGIDFHHQMDRLIGALDEMFPATGSPEDPLRRRHWWAFWRRDRPTKS